MKKQKIIDFLSHWAHLGHMQTFESREEFRMEAQALIDELESEDEPSYHVDPTGKTREPPHCCSCSCGIEGNP